MAATDDGDTTWLIGGPTAPPKSGNPDALIESSGDLVRAAREMAGAARDSAAGQAMPATLDCIEAALGALATTVATNGVSDLANRALHSQDRWSDETFLNASRRLGDLHRRLLSAKRACRPARDSLVSGPAEPRARVSRESIVWLGHRRANR
jgi:hypothetical protein